MAQEVLAPRDQRVDDEAATPQYLYAIVDGLPRRWRPPARGVGAAVVAARAVRDLTLIASPLPTPLPATPRSLAQHHEVVATTLEARAVLPLRFGTIVPAPDVDDWLLTHLGLVRHYLAQLRGCVEMTVRLARLEIPRHTASARALASAARQGLPLSAVAEWLVERAEVPHWRYRPLGRDSEAAASIAFLVARDDVPSFLARIAPVASRVNGVAVVPTGPWPAYSFVEDFDGGRVAMARPSALAAVAG